MMNTLLFYLLLAAPFIVEGAAIEPLHEDASQIRQLLKVLQQSIETSETLLEFIDYRANEIEESLEGTVDCYTKEDEKTEEGMDVVVTGEQPEWKTELPTQERMTENIHDKHVVFESEGPSTAVDYQGTTDDPFSTQKMYVTTPVLGDLRDDNKTQPPVPGPSGPGEAVQHCFIKGANDFSEMYNHAKMDYNCLMTVYRMFGDSRGSLVPYHGIQNAKHCDTYANSWRKIIYTVAGCERLRIKCKRGKGNSNKSCCQSMKCFKDIRLTKANRRRN